MIVRKQSVKDNSEWLKAFEVCTDIYSFSDIENLEREAIELLRSKVKHYKNACNGGSLGRTASLYRGL